MTACATCGAVLVTQPKPLEGYSLSHNADDTHDLLLTARDLQICNVKTKVLKP